MADYYEVVTKSGEVRRRPVLSQWDENQTRWVVDNAKELYFVRDDGTRSKMDVASFSPATASRIGVATAPVEYETSEQPEDKGGIFERGAKAAGRAGLGFARHLSAMEGGASMLAEPIVRAVLPDGAKGEPGFAKERKEESDAYWAERIEKLGGEDFWSKAGEWAGFAATTALVRKGLGVGTSPKLPPVTKNIKADIIKLIAAGDKAGVKSLIAKATGREAILSGGTGLIHEAARTGDIASGIAAAPGWAAMGAIAVGGGGLMAKRSAMKILGETEKSESAKRLVSELWSDIVSLKDVSDEAYEARKLYAGTWAKAKSLLESGEQEAVKTIGGKGAAALKDPSPSMVWVTDPLRKYKSAMKKDISDTAKNYFHAKALDAELSRNPKYTLPSGWDAKKIKNTISGVDVDIKKIDSAGYAAIKEMERRIAAHNDWKLKLLKDAEIIGENDIKRMKSARGYYFTLSRDMSDDLLQTLGGKKGSSLKRRSTAGSTRELSDPIEAMTRDFAITVAMAERNKVMKTVLTDMIKKPEFAKTISIVKKGTPDKVYSLNATANSMIKAHAELKPNQFIISRDIGGGEVMKQIIQIDDPLIAKALTTGTPREISEFGKLVDYILVGTAKAKRFGIVTTTSFMVKNLLKSMEQSVIHAPTKDNGKIWSVDNLAYYTAPKSIYNTMRAATRIIKGAPKDLGNDIPKTVEEAIKRGDLEALWLQHGGGGMVQEGKSAFTENAVRSAVAEQVYLNSIKNGATPEVAANRAAMARRNIGGDYGEKGQVVRGTTDVGLPISGRHIPFLNATIAGTRDVAEAIKRDPAGFGIRTFQMSVVPAAIRFNALKDEEWYWDLPANLRVTRQYFTENFWLPRTYSVPGFISFATEELLRMNYKINPVDTDAWMQALQGYAISTPIPPLVEFLAMKSFGHDIWTGKKVEPMYSEGEEKYLRAGTGTTELAKRIAAYYQEDLPGGGVVSPSEIDATSRIFGGSLGQTAMQLGSRATVAMEGGVQPPLRAADIPAIVPFVSKSPSEGSGDFVNRLYEYGNKLDKAENAIKKADKSGNTDKGDELAAKKDNLLSNKSLIKNGIQALKQRREKYLEIKDFRNTDYSPKEKEALLNEIMREMNEIARDIVLEIERSE
jgi:hypothetical protein